MLSEFVIDFSIPPLTVLASLMLGWGGLGGEEISFDTSNIYCYIIVPNWLL